MRRDDKIQEIIWAVDAFEGRSRAHRNAIEVLRKLSRLTQASVRPVYILSPAELNLSLEFTPPWIQYYRPAAEAALTRLVRDANLSATYPPKVLVQSVATKKRSVEVLSDYAKQKRAQLIVLATHARTGMVRFFLGSFAETMILHSRIPVLLVGPRITSPKKLKKILFPTDLGGASEKAFKRFLPILKQLDAHVTLFHSVPNPVEPVVQSGIYLLGGAWVPVHQFFLEDIAKRKKRLRTFENYARRANVSVSSYVDETGSSISKAIVHFAQRESFNLIAMLAQSGALTTAFIGSLTRQVSRHAHCPVWILHS